MFTFSQTELPPWQEYVRVGQLGADGICLTGWLLSRVAHFHILPEVRSRIRDRVCSGHRQNVFTVCASVPQVGQYHTVLGVLVRGNQWVKFQRCLRFRAFFLRELILCEVVD